MVDGTGADGPGEPEAEELLETHHREPSRRLWAGLGAVIVIAAAGGFVLTRTHHNDHPHAGRTSTTRPAPNPPAPADSVSPVPRSPCLDVGGSTLNCGVSATVPRAFVIAIRTVLPAAVVRSASTVTGRDGLVFSRRVLLQSTAGGTVQVRIGPRDSPNAERVNGVDDDLAVEYGGVVARRHVAIALRSAPGTALPPVAALQRLAQDPRLMAVA